VRLSILLAATFVMAIPLGLFGCGGGESSSGTSACFDYSKFQGTTPTVSFKTDVLPVFRNSCALSGSCHGDQGAPETQPYLGPPNSAGVPSDTDIKAIFDKNVNVESLKAKGMKIVKPSDPDNSFLMHKMDSSLACDAVTCDGTACGQPMPLGTPTLAQDKRDIVRRWIAQGAKND